jgi:hypothetical protein
MAIAKKIHHYVFFNIDRDHITDSAFLATDAFEGAQLKYRWVELEPAEGIYDLDMIQRDLDYLTSKGKKLFIQLQDVSFDTSIINVPDYLLNDPMYNGGIAMQYDYPGDDEDQAVPAGWVARRWDPMVQERFNMLLSALGEQFDGKIEGLNLPETSIGFGESGKLFPEGFTYEVYRDAVKENMKALKAAFPNSVTFQYANFMPGEFLPWTDRGYLKDIYEYAEKIGVGVGGPDLRPHRKGQMNNSYKLIAERDSAAPVGIAVQWGNYDHINPRTDKQIQIEELIEFATEYLRVDYIFWCTQEPHYSDRLLPFLRGK